MKGYRDSRDRGAARSRRRLSFGPCARSLVAGHYLPLADNPGVAPESDQTRPLQSDQGTCIEFTWKNPRFSIGALSSALEGPCSLSPHSGEREEHHLSSALAPASSSFFLPASASALAMASLTGFGAPSTRSLASLRPRPVSSRTALMTDTLLAPISVSMSVNSVCSSTTGAAAPPPPPPPPGAAIAAADTPNFSSIALTRSLSSITDMLSRAEMNASLSNAI